MPLRDHFRPPLDNRTSWDGFHGQWPAMIVMALYRQLPPRYVAAPNIHLGTSIEIDVAAFEEDEADTPSTGRPGENGGLATVLWAPPTPTLAIATDLPDQDEYEVRIYDTKHGRRLVAAIEIVSPANKDRPEHRRAFVAKCAALLRERVCVAIVDLVTTRSANLHADLLEFHGHGDLMPVGSPTIYAATCRWSRKGDASAVFENWAYPLTLGQPLPTLPLWIAPDLAVPLELEPCYEETCRVLRIG
jgi:hypothetical protein